MSQPKYPKGLLWRMNLMELQAIADSESISYPDDVKHHVLYRIILEKMPMIDDSAPVAPSGAQPGPLPLISVDEKPSDDSPASARIKRIRQAN